MHTDLSCLARQRAAHVRSQWVNGSRSKGIRYFNYTGGFSFTEGGKQFSVLIIVFFLCGLAMCGFSFCLLAPSFLFFSCEGNQGPIFPFFCLMRMNKAILNALNPAEAAVSHDDEAFKRTHTHGQTNTQRKALILHRCIHTHMHKHTQTHMQQGGHEWAEECGGQIFKDLADRGDV